MISNISIWAKGIVIAVIIGTIIEMILPENKNKKYVKVVIGIYVLFCMISPVVGSSFNLSETDMEKYLFLNETSNKESNLNNNDEIVDKIFKENASAVCFLYFVVSADRYIRRSLCGTHLRRFVPYAYF